jgi:hypothetical protein
MRRSRTSLSVDAPEYLKATLAPPAGPAYTFTAPSLGGRSSDTQRSIAPHRHPREGIGRLVGLGFHRGLMSPLKGVTDVNHVHAQVSFVLP